MTRDQVVGLVVVMTGMAVAALDTTVVGTAMPTAIDELGGVDRYAWVFSAYLLVSTSTTPVFGRVSDLYGRKRVYGLALVVFVVASMLCGQSQTMDELILFRALQGLGAGALISTGITMIGDLFDVKQRGRVQGFTASVWATAALVGPAIGGGLTQALSWRWAFYVNLPIGLIALGLLMTLHEREEHHGGRIDWLGAALIASAASALLLGMNGTYAALTLPIAVALGGLFIAHERGAADGIVDLSLLRVPIIGTGLAISVIMGAVQFASTAFVPPFVQGVLARSPIEAGIALGAMGLAWPIGSTTTGWFLLRIGVRRAVIIGSVMPVAGMLVLVLLDRDAPLWILALAAAGIGAGQGIVNTPLIVAIQSAVGYGRRGVVTSLFSFTRSLGGAIGVGALGAVLATVVGGRSAELANVLDPRATPVPGGRDLLAGGIHAVFLVMLGLVVLGLILALRIPPHTLGERIDERETTRPPGEAVAE